MINDELNYFFEDLNQENLEDIITVNSRFNPIDSYVYYRVLKKYKPKRIIEIGCGYSTVIALQTLPVEMILIDISFGLFHNFIKNKSLKGTYTKIRGRLEHGNTDVFKILEKDDILFIDSSHKGGDVDYYLNNIFPILNDGVLVHIHDIYYNTWEYPPHVSNRKYNEMFKVKEHLSDFDILYCTDSLSVEQKQSLMDKLGVRNYRVKLDELGCSLWIRKSKTIMGKAQI